MKKYLMGRHDCWLKYKPESKLSNCWKYPDDESGSVYNIEVICIFEDDNLIKTLPGKPFVDVWWAYKKDFSQDIQPQFYKCLKDYLKAEEP